MKKTIFLLASLLALGSISMASAQKKIVEITTSQARNVEPQSAIVIAPQVAELSVKQEKAFATYVYEHDGSVDLTNASAKALSDFQKEHMADVIIGALIDTKTDSRTVSVTVQGYPATYSKIRPATNEDLWMLSFTNSTNSQKNTDAVNNKK